jgi:hypothetical protein
MMTPVNPEVGTSAMKTLSVSTLFLSIVLATVAEPSYGQQPPDVVVSDGLRNTAMGTDALISLSPDTCGEGPPTCDFGNTASGYKALYSNQSGAANTAVGAQALYSNSFTDLPGTLLQLSGNANTAVGYQALYSNIAGYGNTAVGNQALYSNTDVAIEANLLIGNFNTAVGTHALYANTRGENNTAAGAGALVSNTTGNNNIAFGRTALKANTTGSNNIGQGFAAGSNLTTGSNNIDIGNAGMAAESGIIRIGTKSTQTATYIAGIYDVPIIGNAVVVTSTGQLGVTVSSERFKTTIAPMGSNTAKLQQLRPVTFHLKTDLDGALQYGLIAEEVAKVYPELVVRDVSGRIDGVRYDELAPMLLNEVQQEQQKITAQSAEIRALKQQQKQFATQAEVQDLKQQLQAALVKLHAQDKLVVQR